tara:strand:+ start:102277 stop:103287 length:1011 start_codon:yes stop_codon:yes gene_type:complete
MLFLFNLNKIYIFATKSFKHIAIKKSSNMKRPHFVLVLFLIYSIQGFAQDQKKEQDIKAIKAMCGCYDIEFKYAETFSGKRDYELASGYRALAREWVELIQDDKDKLSLQHLLVVNDTMVIKHWRQDWEYQNQKVFSYDKDNNWIFKTLDSDEVKGQWTQKVYQVDDSPRYSGSATWIHSDGRHYWEKRTPAPLPRREYTKRDDYNVMFRTNHQEITDYGWVHEQDNDKVLRVNGENDELIAQEKGLNIYTKVPDEECLAAQNWWNENSKFWSRVRNSWNKFYNREGDFTLAKAVDRKPLFMHFGELEKNNANKREISKLIEKFITDATVGDKSGK